MDVLSLPYLKVLQVKETGTDYYITAETVDRPSLCPHCGALSPQLTGHGRKKQIFQDVLIHGKRVAILVDRHRYTCQECGRTFLEQLVDMDEKRNVTKRLLHYIQNQAIINTFTGIAKEIGLDEKTIRLIFKDYIDEKLEMYRPEAPRWLGLYEAHLLHDDRCVLANIEASTILDILENRKQATVSNYLSRLTGKERIECVCMDMWQPYRNAVNQCLPNAKIIIEKYHIMRHINEALDSIRKAAGEELTPAERRVLMHGRFIFLKRSCNLTSIEHQRLRRWLCDMPLLKLAYELKEEFYDIFDKSANRDEAGGRYDQGVSRITPDLEKYFNSLVALITKWRVEIFNYFDAIDDHPLLRSGTEPLGRLIKRLECTGGGYSFTVLRARILLTVFGKMQAASSSRSRYQKEDFICGRAPENVDDHQQNMGIHLPTLLKAFKSDRGKIQS